MSHIDAHQLVDLQVDGRIFWGTASNPSKTIVDGPKDPRIDYMLRCAKKGHRVIISPHKLNVVTIVLKVDVCVR